MEVCYLRKHTQGIREAKILNFSLNYDIKFYFLNNVILQGLLLLTPKIVRVYSLMTLLKSRWNS